MTPKVISLNIFNLFMMKIKAWMAIIALPILGILPDYFYIMMRKLFSPDNADKIMQLQTRHKEKVKT